MAITHGQLRVSVNAGSPSLNPRLFLSTSLSNILSADLDQGVALVAFGSRAAHTTPALLSDLTNLYANESPQYWESCQFTNDTAGTVWTAAGRFSSQSAGAHVGQFAYAVLVSTAGGAGATVLDYVDLGAIS